MERVREFLDENRVKYVTLGHSVAFTAQEIAAAAHVSGKELAKTVIVKIDGKLAMGVLRAPDLVDLDLLAGAAGARQVELAHEEDFRDRFPDSEVGAMPPFGNLYGMEVYVDEQLTEQEEIAFNAGSLHELIRMPYRDFERLVRPEVAAIATD